MNRMILETESDVAVAHAYLTQYYEQASKQFGDYVTSWLVRAYTLDEIVIEPPQVTYDGSTPRLCAIAEMLNGYVASASARMARAAKNDRAPLPPPSLEQLLDARLQQPLGKATAEAAYWLWESARRSPPKSSALDRWPTDPVVQRVLAALNHHLDKLQVSYWVWPTPNNPPTVAEILYDPANALLVV